MTAVQLIPAQQTSDLEPIVMLHGWGNHPSVMLSLAKALASERDVFLMSLPGYDLSEEPSSWSLNAIAAQLLDEAPQQAIWLGWSLGGTIATYVAANYSGRVTKLITLATNPHFLATPEWPNGVPFPLFETFLKGMTNPDKTLGRFLSLMVVGEGDHLLALLKEIKQISKTNRPSDQTLLESLKLLGSENLIKEFSGLTQPSLHLLGQTDAIVPIALAEQLKSLNPNATVAAVPGSHVFFMSQQNQVVPYILNWLEQL